MTIAKEYLQSYEKREQNKINLFFYAECIVTWAIKPKLRKVERNAKGKRDLY